MIELLVIWYIVYLLLCFDYYGINDIIGFNNLLLIYNSNHVSYCCGYAHFSCLIELLFQVCVVICLVNYYHRREEIKW